MYKRCRELTNKLFPRLTVSERRVLLFWLTVYPLGGEHQVRSRLQALAANTDGTLEAAIDYADELAML